MPTKKKVDPRVRTLLERSAKTRTRGLFVIVGDRGRDQVMNLHYLMTKVQGKARPSVLWCYNKDLGFSSNRQKRMREIEKKKRKGVWDPDRDNPFELFLSATQIRWTYYKESHKVLGQTFGMCVLQDFEAITPNILCRTIETVEGGGCVVLLLHTMDSLRQLYSMAMDVHSRFRTAAYDTVVARFNERFLLTLGDCSQALVLDDELNVLPISRHARALLDAAAEEGEEEGSDDEGGAARGGGAAAGKLGEIKAKLATADIIGPLVEKTATTDQAQALLMFAEAVSKKSLRSTVALTAGRGRGKSAALGLAVASAIGFGYGNIFVTAPHPENLGTFFEFVVKGLLALSYREHVDFDVISSAVADYNGATVRINIFRGHRQTVQYFRPQDARLLGPAELVVVDEAAAIPLPLVRSMLGPYLVFLASTINGYEGTGRSLSLKLVRELRENQGSGGDRARSLREVELRTPIRYAQGDPVEAWLTKLLCLDATSDPYKLSPPLPPADATELFYIDRDALFSYHSLAESFLQRVMSLYVSSHYKNSPNDLQLLSDAPAHRLFALLGPARPGAGVLPDVLCVVQVCLEGRVPAGTVRESLGRGKRASGDLIPWTLSQQYQDDEIPTLSGARVVRIATHPDAQGMGYGSRALALLTSYFQGDIVSASPARTPSAPSSSSHATSSTTSVAGGASSLLTEEVAPRKELPPLLVALVDRPPERLHWLGASFGVTRPLFQFWSRAGFTPLYLRQTANELTAEHTTIVVKPLACGDLPEAPAPGWLCGFASDFAKRMVALTGISLRHLDPILAVDLVFSAVDAGAAKPTGAKEAFPPLSPHELTLRFSRHDLIRLESYARNLVDHTLVADLIPEATHLAFLGRLPGVRFTRPQGSVLLALALQHRDAEEMERLLGVRAAQVLAMYNKAVRKISTAFRELQDQADAAPDGIAPRGGADARASLLHGRGAGLRRTTEGDDSDDADDGAPIAAKPIPEGMAAFAVRGDADAWASAEKESRRRLGDGAAPSTLSVPVAESRKTEPDIRAATSLAGKKRRKSDAKSPKKHKKAKKGSKKGGD